MDNLIGKTAKILARHKIVCVITCNYFMAGRFFVFKKKLMKGN